MNTLDSMYCAQQKTIEAESHTQTSANKQINLITYFVVFVGHRFVIVFPMVYYIVISFDIFHAVYSLHSLLYSAARTNICPVHNNKQQIKI